MNQRERTADDQTGDPAVFRLAGDAEDREHKHAGEENFDDQRLHGAAIVQPVGAETVGRADQPAQDGGSGGRAQKLRDDIAHEIRNAHAAVQQDAQGDGGVDVAAGDVADGIRHGDNHQTERQRRHQIGSVRFGCAARHGGDAAGEQDQNEGADKFGGILFHVAHNTYDLSSFVWGAPHSEPPTAYNLPYFALPVKRQHS